MRLIAFSIVFMVGCALWAQPTFNKRYTFGSENSGIYCITSNDTSFFVCGTMQDSDGTYQLNFFLSQLDNLGNPLKFKEYDFDTTWSGSTTICNLIHNYDGKLITSIHFEDYIGVFKFDNNCDTIWTNIFEEDYFQDGFNTNLSGALKIIYADSSIIGIQSFQKEPSLENYLQIFKLSKTGEIIFKNNILTEITEYDYFRALSFTPISDGYLIACNLHKDDWEENERFNTHLIKTDLLGNVVTQKTLTDNPYEYAGTGLTQTSDGGFIYGGVVGAWRETSGVIVWAHYVVKLDENLDKEWALSIGQSIGGPVTMLYKIIDLGNDEYLGIGNNVTADSLNWVGTIYKFNLDRQVLWKSDFLLVTDLGGGGLIKPEHRFYDGVQTPDGGFILVGDIDDAYSSSISDTTYYSWIVKTDSFGCLVPGCQDVLSTNPSAVHFKFSIYPNPTTDYLNLYYNTATFSENTTAELYSIQGQHLQSWRLSQNNTTYMLDIQGIPPGTYVLNLIGNGTLLQSEKVVIGG